MSRPSPHTTDSVKMIPSHPKDSTLKLVHILFRHGNRSPDRGYTYTNNMYDNDFPLCERGQLTLLGKRNAYKLGQLLRKRYSDLLKDGYCTGVVEARTSDYDRTKTSMLLVLAGLFPPTPSETWNSDLKWQPIPYSYTSMDTDKVVHRLFKEKFTGVCSAEYTADEKELFKYLTEHTGDKVSNIGEVFFLYIILASQEEHGLELPEWSKKVYPEPMHSVGAKLYLELIDSEDHKKKSSGGLLQKIIEDSILKLSRSPAQTNRKLHLYCGHEYNMAFLLITLGLFDVHIPGYLSHLAIEVHTIDGVDCIKILYAKTGEAEPEILQLPNYEEFCPLEDFKKIVAKYLPDDDSSC